MDKRKNSKIGTVVFRSLLIYILLLTGSVSASVQESVKITEDIENRSYNFCINTRKWLKVSRSLALYFYLLSESENHWGQNERGLLGHWVINGQGHALSHFFSKTSKRSADYKYFLSTLGLGKNALCPLPCDYDEFENIYIDLNQEEQKRLKNHCMPNCVLNKPIGQNVLDYCDCSIRGKGCEKLNASIMLEIKRLDHDHKVLLRKHLRGKDRLFFEDA